MYGRAYETYSDEELYFRYLSKPPLTPLTLLPIYNLCPTQTSPVLRLVGRERAEPTRPSITEIPFRLESRDGGKIRPQPS